MKEKINRYARGVFEFDPQKVVTDENNIFAIVDKNKEFKGTFCIYEEKGRELKGLVYSGDDRVRIAERSFIGSRVNIDYCVESADSDDGEVIDNCFYIVSNGGELTIPYSFRIEAGCYEAGDFEIRNLDQFARLAQDDNEEAITLFEADDFRDIFLMKDLSLCCVYDNFEKGIDVRNNIEEFLIAAGKKKRPDITLSCYNREYRDIEENFKDTVVIEKDTWGYTNVKVNVDAPFIRIERKNIESDVFTGSKYEFSYVIDASKLHGGNNYGRITFETINKSMTLTIVASKPFTKPRTRAKEHKLIYDLITLYIRFRTRAVHVSEWIRESGIVIEALLSIDEDNVFYKLAKAQLYIAEKKDDKAKAIIDSVKDDIAAENEKEYILYCYFIYVNTLYNRDWAYSKRASSMIKECYDKYDDWRILWTLLFIDEELESNPSLKLLRMKEQFNRDCKSPVMYLEACRTFNQNPGLLRVLNNFEVNVLLFGAKNKFLEDKLTDRVLSLVTAIRNKTPQIVKLMLLIWENDTSNQVLECLCRTLVRNNYVGEKYLPIYKAGIEADIKITQLFEYYMASRNQTDMSPLPKMVTMYFGYNNDLDYIKKSYLYADIINNKTDNPQTYRTYLPQMELFLKEQLMAGNINDNLVVIYRDLLKPDMINKDNAAAVAKLFHIRRVTVNNKNYAKVIVRHKEIKGETEFPVLKNTAFIQTYTDNVSISFVSNRGNRFNGGKDYTITTLFDDESIVKRCLELNPDMENVMIGYCDRMLKYPKQSVDSIEKIKETISYGCISEPYRKKLISRVIEYYYDGFDADGFESFIKTIDESNLSGKDAVKIMEIRIIMGEYDKAYALLKNHSAMNIVPKRLMKMCSKKISCVEEEKKRLVEIAYIAFSQGAYDDNILKYLIAYYNGATDKMVEIWKAAGEIEEDTFEFEERILAQMMFTGKITDISTHIFSHYCSRGPKDRIVKAYLSLNSYLYFVKECSMPEELFELIEAWFENEKSLSDVCKMALLKYYSSQEKLTEYRKELASVNLYYLARKGIVFPFYQSFEKWIHLPYDISDRTMIEYKADPKSRVVIHYMYESKEHKKKYVAEDMKQVYEGIFVKQFVLFYGETMQYYISEETDGKKNVTDSVTISNNCIRPLKSEGRYEMLNDIIASQDTHEPEALKILVHSYAVNNAVTEQMFTML